jgi:hypothetical protein
METTMHKTLQSVGFLDGNVITPSGQFFQRTRLLTPNDVHFVLMCAQNRVQIADAVGMIMSVGQIRLSERDPLIMDDMLESYIELGRLIT